MGLVLATKFEFVLETGALCLAEAPVFGLMQVGGFQSEMTSPVLGRPVVGWADEEGGLTGSLRRQSVAPREVAPVCSAGWLRAVIRSGAPCGGGGALIWRAADSFPEFATP